MRRVGDLAPERASSRQDRRGPNVRVSLRSLLRPTLLLAAIWSLVVMWTEAFPTAHGQTERELRTTAVGRMSAPVGAHVISRRFEPAKWIGHGFSLFGELPQVFCARIIDEYVASDAQTFVDAVYASARASGLPVGNTPSLVPAGGVSFDQGTTMVHLSVGAPDGSGSRVTIVVADLPESIGGHRTGGRLGIYRTVMNY